MPYGYNVEGDDFKIKQYRKWIDTPLEDDDQYLENRPFDTYEIKRGKNCKKKGGVLGFFKSAKKKK